MNLYSDFMEAFDLVKNVDYTTIVRWVGNIKCNDVNVLRQALHKSVIILSFLAAN